MLTEKTYFSRCVYRQRNAFSAPQVRSKVRLALETFGKLREARGQMEKAEAAVAKLQHVVGLWVESGRRELGAPLALCRGGRREESSRSVSSCVV